MSNLNSETFNLSASLLKQHHAKLRRHKANVKKFGQLLKSFDSSLRSYNAKLKKQNSNLEIVLFSSQLRDMVYSLAEGFLKEHRRLKTYGGSIKKCKKAVNKTVIGCKKDYSEAQRKASKL